MWARVRGRGEALICLPQQLDMFSDRDVQVADTHTNVYSARLLRPAAQLPRGAHC